MGYKKRVFFHTITTESGEKTAENKTIRFQGTSKAEFIRWQSKLRSMIGKEIGVSVKVPLRPEVLRRNEFPDYVREKVVYNVEPGLSAVAWLCRPRKPNKKLPAVIVCHGHGPGKDPLVGLYRGKPAAEYHKLVSVRLAQAGYITLTPDQRGYGECSQFTNGYPDSKDLMALDYFYRRTRGVPLLTLNIRDVFRAVDYLHERTDVDTERVASFGMGNGAAVTSVATLLDKRIQVVSLACFLKEEVDPLGWDLPFFPGISLAPLLKGRGGPVDVCALICPRTMLTRKSAFAT